MVYMAKEISAINNDDQMLDRYVYGFFRMMRPYIDNSFVSLGILGSILYLRKINSSLSITIMDKRDSNNVELKAMLSSEDQFSIIVEHFIGQLQEAINLIPEDKDSKVQKICDLFQPFYAISNKLVSVIFEKALLFVSKNQKFGGEYAQPKEIAELTSKIIDCNNNTVFNPYSGMASYAMFMNHYAKYDGMELNSEIAMLSVLRLKLADRLDNVVIENKDVSGWTTKKYDVVITTPPFRIKIAMHDASSSPELGETIALRRFEKSTTENGQLFTVVPMSFLWSHEKEYAKVRKNLINKDYIDTIIMLPGNIFFSTPIGTAIVYLNKKKVSKGIVKIVDATDCFIKEKPTNMIDVEAVLSRLASDNEYLVTPSKDEIVGCGYSLDFSKYSQEKNVEVPEGYMLKKMDELVELLRCSRHFEDIKGHLVTVSSISDNAFDCYHSPEDFPLSENLRNASKLTEPALVVSTIRTPKSNFVKASAEHPVFVSSDVKVFRVNEELIVPEYLSLQLSNLNLQHRGIIIPRISTETIMKANIVMPPSVDTQKSIVIERSNDDKLAKARELGLQDVIDKMKAEYINEVRMRKHDMRPYLREISSAEKMIRFYLSKRDSMEDFDSKVLRQLDNCRENIHKLSDLLEKLSSEEEFGKPELIDVNDYFFNNPSLKDMEDTQDKPGYKVVYQIDGGAFKEVGLPYNKLIYSHVERLLDSDGSDEFIDQEMRRLYDGSRKLHYMVEMAHEDWDRLVLNILENSRKHGFTDFGKKYEFDINLSVESFNGKLMYRIDFADNGNPLPEGMDKERYGLLGEKAGKTAGTGQGGSIVKRIVEHYGGRYDIFSNGEGTTVRVWLPVPEKKGK